MQSCGPVPAGSLAEPVSCLCLVIGGCYSSDYRSQTAATASMLGDLADKLGDYCQAGFKLGSREVRSEEMGEFYYALKKARSYASEAASNSNRQSYRDLTRLIADSTKLVGEADRYRLAGQARPAASGRNHERAAARHQRSQCGAEGPEGAGLVPVTLRFR